VRGYDIDTYTFLVLV